MRRRLACVCSLLLALTLVLAGCAARQKGAATKASPEDAGQQSIEAEATAVEEVEDERLGDEESEEAIDETAGEEEPDDVSGEQVEAIDEDGTYTSKDEVALYLYTFGHLPHNYITKDEAEDEGWKTEGLSLDEACPGMSIGGDRFGNREGLLPTAKGRKWYECDIDYVSGNRNAKRIVYSNDGLIYYTDDHYQSFERLY